MPSPNDWLELPGKNGPVFLRRGTAQAGDISCQSERVSILTIAGAQVSLLMPPIDLMTFLETADAVNVPFRPMETNLPPSRKAPKPEKEGAP